MALRVSRGPGVVELQAVLKTLAERGTLVAPDAATRLAQQPDAANALLERNDLPWMLTLADLEVLLPRPTQRMAPLARDADEAPPVAAAPPAQALADPPAPALVAPSAAAAAPAMAASVVAPAPPPTAPVAVPPPFTPDARGALLEEPVAIPRRYQGTKLADKGRLEPLPSRPRLMDPYAHKTEILADVTGNSTCEGAISDFTRYFSDRLQKIRKLLRQRREMVGAVPINKAKTGGVEVKLIGMVTEIRTTKNGHRLLELEDETGSVNILAPASDNQIIVEADTAIEDEVIGVICKPPGRGDLLILQRIVRPDIPMSSPQRRSSSASAVAVLSDVHMGSKTFLADDWERFIKWINLEWGDSRMKALARKVRYLVINGDMVDGIGMFPGQEDELAIVDGYEQYAFAGEELNRIRDDIQIFLLPGNHDLVRPAEPQPALPEKYKRLFPETVRHIGNPCKLSIEGVEFLAYHGRSMDDWIMRVSGLTYENPLLAMKEMLQRRHVLPVYGLRTPIAPEHKDYLAIDTVPDVFVTGHVHAAGLEQYRGVTLINASCWQSQTAYQKLHGFMPEPAKVPVIELDTGKSWMVDFHRDKPSGVDVVGRSHFGDTFRRPARIDDPGSIV